MEPWHVLVVDDDPEIAEQVADVIRSDPGRESNAQVLVDIETNFEAALAQLDTKRYDLLVLDVRDQQIADDAGDQVDQDEDGSDVTSADTGLKVFHRIRALRFVPVIFHTGLSNLVDERMVRSPFVQVVSKVDSDSTPNLRKSVNAVLQSTLPAIHRALNVHVENVVRDFMAEFVEQHWDQLQSPTRKGDLTHLLLRRLALSLGNGGQVLSSLLADENAVQLTEEQVHPMRFYVMPPVGDFTTGDLMTTVDGDPSARDSPAPASDNESESNPPGRSGKTPSTPRWFVVLTPACDLVPARLKADYVVLVECVALEATPEFQRWLKARPASPDETTKEYNKSTSSLSGLMRNNRHERPADRDYFLPAAWSVPNLMVDFQRLSSVTVAELETGFRRVATIDSPYVDALVETFSRYLGRRGTPDLDTKYVIEQIGRDVDGMDGSGRAPG